MAGPRVLVLVSQRFKRSVLIEMLNQLGVRDVIQASNCEQAMAKVQQSGPVDIVLCDLADRGFDSVRFLDRVSEVGMAAAVALCGELQPEMRRALGQMGALSGLRLLGVMSSPMHLEALRKILHRYNHRPSLSAYLPGIKALPSEQEILRALVLGEFRAWYQPKFVLSTGALAGIEVLARWEHPLKGVLLPMEFLGAVMAYDLVDEMFKQLLEQGLAVLDLLRRKQMQLEMSLNLHASQLISDDLVGHIQGALEQHDFPGSTLTFELAENGLLDLSPRIHENLLRLRMLGCGLSVDDFAVGFSSLKLLCQLPFNQLKLDGEFVQHVDEPHNQTLIISTLALARSLNMSLVIEGISSQRIHDGVVAMGCEIGQGFHLARPMSNHSLELWLDAHATGLDKANIMENGSENFPTP